MAAAANDKADLARLEEDGITWVTLGFPNPDRVGYIDALQRWADRML